MERKNEDSYPWQWDQAEYFHSDPQYRDEAGFCSGSSVEGCADRNPAGFGGSMPFNPDNLGTALWNHNVVYRIGSAVDMEGYVGWIIRIDFTVCIYCDTGDDIGIIPGK